MSGGLLFWRHGAEPAVLQMRKTLKEEDMI
jgi:hypothetical protein